jgi:hypothetical protein
LHQAFRIRITLMRVRIPLFILMRIRIRLFTLMRIRILFLVKVMQICDHWSEDSPRLHFDPPRLHCERKHPPLLHFEPPQLIPVAMAPESTTPAVKFAIGTVDTCGNFPLVSLIPVVHLDLRISPNFRKNSK